MSKNIDMSSWFFNQNFNGVSDDFFDDSLGFDDGLNLIDFPLEPENGVVEDWGAKFESVEMPSPDDLASLSSTFCAQGCNEAKKSPVLLNQLPKILEDDRSNSSSSKGSCLFQTSSPVSVLDSNSSSSNSAVGHLIPFNTKITVPAKRRSKRPQKSSSISEPWWKRSPTPDLFPEKATNPLKRKRKKLTSLTQAEDQSETTRKCTHCEATKTPQWREGPMGPKTLCNACGVRYRSGRLFPEYRPVASPTFVPSLHSNSHKKVAELRKKAIHTGGDNRASMETLPLPLVQENSLI